MFNRIIIILVILIVGSINEYAQYVYGPVQSDYRRQMTKIYQQSTSGSNKGIEETLEIGVRQQQSIGRGIYQWNFSSLGLPEGTIIDSVSIEYKYNRGDATDELGAQFYALEDTINGSSFWDEGEWNEFNTNNKVGEVWGAPNTVLYLASNEDLVSAANNALTIGNLVIGVRSSAEAWSLTRRYNFFNSFVKLRIVYSPPSKRVVINQKLSNGLNAGQFKVWEIQNNNFSQPYDAGDTLTFPIGVNQRVLAEQNILNSQKFNFWNNEENNVINYRSFPITENISEITAQLKPTTQGVIIGAALESLPVSGGVISFKDPWLIDYSEAPYGYRNRGDSAECKNRTAPFSPNYTTNFGNDIYKGVFLNINPNFLNNIPVYSLQAPETQSINGYPSVFMNWSVPNKSFATLQDSTALETAVVFKNANAVVYANYKGIGLSNSSSAISNPGQYKIAQSTDGKLHRVYESGGQIWYEYSTGGGWTLGNNGHPVSTVSLAPDCKSPAITITDIGYIFIVYSAITTSPYCNLYMAILNSDGSFRETVQIYENVNLPSYGTSYASIASESRPLQAGILVVWNTSGGLSYRFGICSSAGSFDWKGSNTITGTNSSSAQHALCGSSEYSNQNQEYHLVWQQNLNEIKYRKIKITLSGSNVTSINQVKDATPSTGCGSNFNGNPSVISYGPGARVIWTGSFTAMVEDDNKIEKTSTPPIESSNVYRRVVLRSTNDTTWANRFWKFGSDVGESHINRTPQNNYAIAYSTVGGANYYPKSVIRKLSMNNKRPVHQFG